MPENEKTKGNIQIYLKEVSSSQFAAGDSGPVPVPGVWRDES